MSLERRLIDIIKENFAAKSSAQLHAILQSRDLERWSEEAFVAAEELLAERRDGIVPEPATGEAESVRPSNDPLKLAVKYGLLAFGVAGAFLSRTFFDLEDASGTDVPVPFGPKAAWLALDTTDCEAVAAALYIRELRVATWEEGVAAAYKSSVFVTPPVGQWTLAVSTDLNAFEQTAAAVRPLLERLSRRFRDAQYFCTNQDIGTHVWARARRGEFVRGFGWNGQAFWNEGGLTPEERDLGFEFGDGQPPTEDSVMQLASVWSIDPTSLNEQYKEPVMGLLGEFATVETAG